MLLLIHINFIIFFNNIFCFTVNINVHICKRIQEGTDQKKKKNTIVKREIEKFNFVITEMYCILKYMSTVKTKFIAPFL